ncbi:hypothetical protein A2U01_0010592, partial [Trifolium medium]|nr:hypothetical protein [Trifolium medium]
METYRDYLDVTSIGGFRTIYFIKQKFGEVDPDFVHQFGDQLPEKWRIMDYRFDEHFVTFNKDESHPLLMDGWHEMREVFDLHQNEEIQFAYYGKDVFGIMGSKRFETEDQLPNFHSRCVTPGTCHRFQVDLTRENIRNPYFDIWNAFAIFVRKSNFNVLTACCDNGTKTDLEVAIHENPFKMTAFGPDWFGFCRKNDFRAGDVLCFKFSL